MTEFELIEYYFKQHNSQTAESIKATDALYRDAKVTKGIGDDAAVVALESASKWVTCVDTLIQGRHFSNDWDQIGKLAFAIGYKSVVVNVSDIAAMGATPHSLLLALALPERLANETWLNEFAKGLFHACKQYGLSLIGGDTTRNDKLVISVTANGLIKQGMSPIYRQGAQVGDKIYVSGTLGDACYALYHSDNEIGHHLAPRLHMPTPRVKLGQTLAREGLATSMIDVSDGLIQDLGHICEQSGVSMRINLEHLPTSDQLHHVELAQRLQCQLTGGDDYELAFTLPASITLPSNFISSVFTNVTCIGEVIELDSHRAINTAANTKIDNNKMAIKLFYHDQEVTKANPSPFNTYPNLTGYQHFTDSQPHS